MAGEKGESAALYRMGRWHCYTLMLLHQAPAVGWIMAAAIVALTVAGFILSPWIGVAAIGFDFFILVMGLSFVIMVYGFHSVTGVNMIPHRFAQDGKNLILEFEEGDPEVIPKASLRPYRIYPGGVLVPVEGERRGWIWIPPKAFEDDGRFQGFIKQLYDESNTE